MENLCRPVSVVVNTGDQNGYGVVANLGERGIPVFSVDSNPKNITFFSKYVKKKLSPDYITHEKQFIDFLINLGKSLIPKPVLFITSDLYLLVILKYRSILERYYHIPYAALETIEKLVDKKLFYKELDILNVPHAQTYLPEGPEEIEKIAPYLDYPFIIKAVHAAKFSKKFGNKCLKINNSKELIDLYYEAITVERRLIVQKEIAGTERYLIYVYMNKESIPLAICCYKKVRIMPIDYGNAVVCKTMWESEAVDICVSVLKSLGFSGLAEGEVQRDSRDCKLKLTEINARSTTEARLAARWGVNMEYLAYQDTIESVKPIINLPKNKTVVWIDILGDIRAVFSKDGYLRKGKITIPQWFQSLRGEKVFAYLNFRDPFPFCIMLWRFIRTFILKKKTVHTLLSLFKKFIHC